MSLGTVIIAILIFNGVIIVLFLCKYLHISITDYREAKKRKAKDAVNKKNEKTADNNSTKDVQ